MLPTVILWTDRAVSKARNNLRPRSRKGSEWDWGPVVQPGLLPKE